MENKRYIYSDVAKEIQKVSKMQHFLLGETGCKNTTSLAGMLRIENVAKTQHIFIRKDELPTYSLWEKCNILYLLSTPHISFPIYKVPPL